jgi:hypothetical protein
MARARHALALLAAGWLAGCPRSPDPAGPIPVAMVPSQGTGLAALPVAIAGDHFDAATETDFEEGSATMNATFLARLIPDAGGATVALEAVRLTEEKRLEAIVPAGIARGLYALEVTDPAGRTGLLPQAFRVVVAPENLATFGVAIEEGAYAGVPFLITLTARDAGGGVVDGFTGQALLSDLTGTLSPTTTGPFVLGTASLRITVATVTAGDVLTAADGLGHSGSSPSFAVAPGPVVTAALASVPATLVVGDCSAPLRVELRDALGNPSPATGAVVVDLQSAPAGALEFHTGGAACNSPVTSVTISAGATFASFRLRGTLAGAAELRAVPAGLPSSTASVILTP